MNKQHELNTAIASRSIKIAMLAMSIGVGAATSAAAAPNPPITSCGKTLSVAGYYQVKGNLSAASGNCITITGSNITVDILRNGASDPCSHTTISGAQVGGTSGIYIAPGAKNTFIQGQNSVIVGFDYGIKDKGTATTVDDINLTNNVTAGVGLSGTAGSVSNFFSGTLVHDPGGSVCYPSLGTQAYGVYMNGGNGSQVFNGILQGNKFGLMESGATNSTVALMLSGGNTADGYQFNSGSKNFIYDDLAGIDPGPTPPLTGNGAYGIDVVSDNGDVVTDNTAGGNTLDDINAAGDFTCNNNTYWFNFANNVSTPCIKNP